MTVPNATLIGLYMRAGHTIDPIVIGVNILISLWRLCLAWHIGRCHKEEEYIYLTMRDRWMVKSKRAFSIYAFTYVLTFYDWVGFSLFAEIAANTPMWLRLLYSITKHLKTNQR